MQIIPFLHTASASVLPLVQRLRSSRPIQRDRGMPARSGTLSPITTPGGRTGLPPIALANHSSENKKCH